MPYGRGDIDGSLRPVYNGWVIYRNIVEPYLPGRCTRQLGYIQRIPRAIPTSEHVIRAWNAFTYTINFSSVGALDPWQMYPDAYCLLVHNKVGDQPAACEPDYMAWYEEVSHPRLLPADDDDDVEMPPPRSSSEYWVGKVADLLSESLQFVQLETCQLELIQKYRDFQSSWNSAQ